MKRPAAIAATLLRRALNPQPMAARAALRIQTLHRPTGQILHRPSRLDEILWAGRRKGTESPPDPPLQNPSQTVTKQSYRKRQLRELAGLCPGGNCVSIGISSITRGAVPLRYGQPASRNLGPEVSSGSCSLQRPAGGPAWLAPRPLSFALPPRPAAWLQSGFVRASSSQRRPDL